MLQISSQLCSYYATLKHCISFTNAQRVLFSVSVHNCHVPHTHPQFYNLGASRKHRGAYIQDQTSEYAPSSGATPTDIDLGLRNITDCCTEASSTTICLRFSCPPETRWSRSPDRDRPQHRQRHFPSTPQACLFNVLIALTPLENTLAIDRCRIP